MLFFDNMTDSHDLTPPVPPLGEPGVPSEPQLTVWVVAKGSDILPIAAGVHLGKRGHGQFVDESQTPVPDAGITFSVVQASQGYTGIKASALPGYIVEALDTDPEATEVRWIPAGDSEVTVAYDRGNGLKTPFEQRNTANIGNPGGKAGIIRVTGSTGEVKYYALGADFQGRPDDWRVTGLMTEVQPRQPESPPGHTSLPGVIVQPVELPESTTPQDSSGDETD